MIELPTVVRIPDMPDAPARAGFPVIATAAPVVLSGIMWLVTGSVYMLLFAVLGPVIALASMFDARRGVRKAKSQAAAQFESDCADTRAQITALHRQQRDDAWARTPSVAMIDGAGAALSRWQPEARPLVVLGRGSVPSSFAVEATARRTDTVELAAEARRCADAPVVVDAGAGIGLVGSVILTRAFARGLVLQLVHRVQPGRLTVHTPPGDGWAWTHAVPRAASAQVHGYGHTQGNGYGRRRGHSSPGDDIGDDIGNDIGVDISDGLSVVVSEDARTLRSDQPRHHEVLIALAESSDSLPPGCSTIVHIDAPQLAGILRSPDHPTGLRLQPELVSAVDAQQLSLQLSALAGELGFGSSATSLPRQIDLHELIDRHELRDARKLGGDVSPDAVDRDSLRCAIGIGTDGVVSVDLVASGPHAIVAGTTGSGKSELLVTWVAALAAAYPADAVNFLLVDFKGGAAFDDLVRLPHCVGIITDLNAAEAGRALESLRAEIRHREETLRKSGAKDIAQDQSGCLARLVIVVDEFQAMLDTFPALHALFVDLAARGRSLGIHLILCTQRPTGVVRDALLANCSLRLSLRVNNAADSVAILGVDDAARLGQGEPGRCLIRTGDGLDLCQVAETRSTHIDQIIARRSESALGAGRVLHAPRRPWLDPLPARVELTDLDALLGSGTAGAVPATEPATEPRSGPTDEPTRSLRPAPRPTSLVLGLADEPERQRYSIARFDPASDGGLLVMGGSGSGRSTLVASLASQASEALSCRIVPPDGEAMWDALADAAGQLDPTPSGRRVGSAAAPRTLLLFDDFDAIYATWGSEHQDAARSLVADLLRRGPADGLHVVLVIGQLVPALHRIAALCPSTLVLGGTSVADLAALGGVHADLQQIGAGDSPHDASRAAEPLNAESGSGPVPGAARWRGHRVQLLASHEHASHEHASHETHASRNDQAGSTPGGERTAWPIRLADEHALLVVSGQSAATCAYLRARVPAGTTVTDVSRSDRATSGERMLRAIDPAAAHEILVGDIDAWQSHWTLFTELRRNAIVVLDRCTLADVRLVARGRGLPPPIAHGRGHVWILQPEGTIVRGVFA